MTEEQSVIEHRALSELEWYLTPDDERVVPGSESLQVPVLYLYYSHHPHSISAFTLLTPASSHADHLALEALASNLPLLVTSESTTSYSKLEVRCEDDASEPLIELIGEIFSLFLVTSRPLTSYTCSFFLPLDLQLSNELEKEDGQRIRIRQDQVEHFKLKPPESLLAMKNKKVEKEAEKEIAADEKGHAQAYEFFYSHLQDQLFETADAKNDALIRPIVHWRLKADAVAGTSLCLNDPEAARSEADEKTGAAEDGENEESRLKVTRETCADVQAVSLYEYYNGIYLLELRVSLPKASCGGAIKALSASADRPAWWQALVYAEDETWQAMQRLQVDHWLRYTKLMRVLYSSFHEQLSERKIAPAKLVKGNTVLAQREVLAPFSEIILYYLQQFLDLPAEDWTRARRLKQVADGRMFVLAAYGLPGTTPRSDTPAMENFERLFSYALYCDERSDANDPALWAYDRDFTRELMTRHVLRRWQRSGSLFGFTDYSSVFMGYGPFFRYVIAPVHVPYVYGKLQILALFYRATMNQLDRRISCATRDLMARQHDSNAFVRLRRYFIRFTNDYWFRELTPQIQGREISSRMLQQQRLADKYELLKDKMDRAAEYAQSLKDHWYQQRADIASWVAGLLAVSALFLAVLDNNSLASWLIFAVTAVAAGGIVFWRHKKGALMPESER